MFSLLRLSFLFALIGSLIIPGGQVFAREPDIEWNGSRPLTKLILAAPGQAKKVAYDRAWRSGGY